MNLVVNNHNIFVIVLVTFLTSLILVPIMKKVAIHINAMDEPNERKIHKHYAYGKGKREKNRTLLAGHTGKKDTGYSVQIYVV